MSKMKRRRHFTAEEKAQIVREHLIDQTSISDLCEKHEIKPSQYYLWQKQLFENASEAFTSSRTRASHAMERQNDRLRKQLAQKDEIIAEVAEAFVTLKKQLGES